MAELDIVRLTIAESVVVDVVDCLSVRSDSMNVIDDWERIWRQLLRPLYSFIARSCEGKRHVMIPSHPPSNGALASLPNSVRKYSAADCGYSAGHRSCMEIDYMYLVAFVRRHSITLALYGLHKSLGSGRRT